MSNSLKGARYRVLAEECRQFAATPRTIEITDHCLDIARRYIAMAEAEEAALASQTNARQSPSAAVCEPAAGPSGGGSRRC
jgi:hypothetical protein